MKKLRGFKTTANSSQVSAERDGGDKFTVIKKEVSAAAIKATNNSNPFKIKLSVNNV